MGATIAYILDASNQYLEYTTWGSSKLSPNKRKALDGLPLGFVNADIAGELALKVVIAGSTGTAAGVVGVRGTLTDNDPGLAAPLVLDVGGKAVTFSTYAPGYTANDNAVLALDKATGALLTDRPKGPSVATASNVTSNAVSVTLLAANAARKGATIYNASDKVLHLSFQATATVDNSVQDLAPEVTLLNGGYYEVPYGYTGVIAGIWEAGPTGKANITEITQ